ncbi:hypothetical protein E1A91_D03G058100v1 [Gossypium mustelinum]|uniref:Uncharacterized protein n=1 Tax=Gossypium mustelinum TaxID=34275 RepID=A0A5D2VJJ1_GOSMU|nr:hypothetical protein E1A91_D03G058100v1 [Gossypium mustelinum]
MFFFTPKKKGKTKLISIGRKFKESKTKSCPLIPFEQIMCELKDFEFLLISCVSATTTTTISELFHYRQQKSNLHSSRKMKRKNNKNHKKKGINQQPIGPKQHVAAKKQPHISSLSFITSREEDERHRRLVQCRFRQRKAERKKIKDECR